jgi:hypothetical protein
MSDSSVFFLGSAPPDPSGESNQHIYVWDPVRGLRDTVSDPGLFVGDLTAVNSNGAFIAVYERFWPPPPPPPPPPALPPSPDVAFIWSEDRGLRVLPPLPGDYSAEPDFINDAGEVFGVSFGAPSPSMPGGVPTQVVWDSQQVPHALRPQYDPDRYFIKAFGNLDQLAGFYMKDDSTIHAFVTLGSLFFDLNPFGSPFSQALQMSGDCIAGWYQKADGNLGFFAHKGLATFDIKPVDTLGNINQAGDAVGTMTLADGSSHAYLARLVNGSYKVLDLTPANQLPGLIYMGRCPFSLLRPAIRIHSLRRSTTAVG